MRISFRLLIIAAGASLLSSTPVTADDDRADEAIRVALAWVAEIDAGKYEASYIDGGSALHDKVQQDTWVKILRTERPTLGKVLNRQETNHSYQPNGFEGMDGEFMVLNYHTAFESKPDEVEHIVLRREDGKWRGVGYNFGPGQVVNDPDSGPTTTISDSPHVTPPKATK